MFSYTGRILHVDLAGGRSWVTHVDESYLKTYVGGVCLATVFFFFISHRTEKIPFL